MKKVQFTEFRKHASQLLSAVEEGESFLVLRHGKPIAEIRPPALNHGEQPSWKKPALRLLAKGADLSQAILQEREREDVL